MPSEAFGPAHYELVNPNHPRFPIIDNELQSTDAPLVGCLDYDPASVLWTPGDERRWTQTALGAFFRRLAARVGNATAVTATARKIAVLFYNILSNGSAYIDPGADYYEHRYRDRVVRGLRARAAAFGYSPVDADAEVGVS